MNYGRLEFKNLVHSESMKCPQCSSALLSKNGRRRNKQNYLCKQCGRQFLEFYDHKGYSDDIKKICLKMHENGMGFREIERVTGVNHNTVIHWHKKSGGSDDEISETQGVSDESEFRNFNQIKFFGIFRLFRSHICQIKKLTT
jgi:transposase-like protein